MFRGLCAVSKQIRISTMLGLLRFPQSAAERWYVTNRPLLSHSEHTVVSNDHISRSAQCAVKMIVT